MPTRFIALLALLLVTNAAVAQQNYPSKTVTLMTTFAPGGSSDLISRLIAQKLTEEWKKQVIVDNRPGGAGVIAMQMAARAVPDGHTLVLGHIGVLAVNPAMLPTLPYDPVKDYAPVSLVATVPTVLAVHPSVPAHGLKELVALTKSKPGEYFYGTAGNGSAGHLAMEYLKQQTGLEAAHVPYKGTGPHDYRSARRTIPHDHDANLGFVALRQMQNHLMHARRFGGGNNGVRVRLGFEPRNILSHGTGKKLDVLREKADMTAERAGRPLIEACAVQPHRSSHRMPDAHHRSRKG
jgi:hypothetical protein